MVGLWTCTVQKRRFQLPLPDAAQKVDEGMSLASYIREAPKAELHLHLEGSIAPQSALEIADRNGVALPTDLYDSVRRRYTFHDFQQFISLYIGISRCLRTVEDYEQITVELGRRLAGQNVKYAEVTFTPSTHSWLGVHHSTYFTGITRGRDRVLRELGVRIAWIFDIVRSIPDVERSRQLADYTSAVAIEGKGNGVVALGLGGHEPGYPVDPFIPMFDRARHAGLHSAPHAGETGGPENVWASIDRLGAERIGHGIRAGEDPALVGTLAARGIALEICPSSNLRLGVCPNFDHYPLRRFYEAGVPVILNTDDPALFEASLTDEFELMLEHGQISEVDLDEMLLNAVKFSFLEPADKAELTHQFHVDLTSLRETHLNAPR